MTAPLPNTSFEALQIHRYLLRSHTTNLYLGLRNAACDSRNVLAPLGAASALWGTGAYSRSRLRVRGLVGDWVHGPRVGSCVGAVAWSLGGVGEDVGDLRVLVLDVGAESRRGCCVGVALQGSFLI
ncbi:hypothetical protein K505DRAFT_59777 [Melanomma pulvis-pyrius CBS 109.77]|uniref:Uncharacterized protein n=1 Tax=Melanomma pulvis-pyrius CBS 109.77 TaxID=1314802 RepID=A0A6A6X7Q4_9PLEO|nr:hypothetical protein K505DRAFT_59777 [Melanomma pulvis-pyrius CBS 109.77]